ncbi:MAG: DUF104 domain-containing protein, partial [Planctomycetes bacterium]|nr:DUF104 domain-containing protein [Planctomycetota bacterium]
MSSGLKLGEDQLPPSFSRLTKRRELTGMSIEIEAVYEKGILKLDHTLPLEEHQRVQVIIETSMTLARRSYGIIGWTGDSEIVRNIALV